MYTIYKQAMKTARETKSVIMRLDIQFNYEAQVHRAYLTLSNGDEYVIAFDGSVIKITS